MTSKAVDFVESSITFQAPSGTVSLLWPVERFDHLDDRYDDRVEVVSLRVGLVSAIPKQISKAIKEILGASTIGCSTQLVNSINKLDCACLGPRVNMAVLCSEDQRITLYNDKAISIDTLNKVLGGTTRLPSTLRIEWPRLELTYVTGHDCVASVIWGTRNPDADLGSLLDRICIPDTDVATEWSSDIDGLAVWDMGEKVDEIVSKSKHYGNRSRAAKNATAVQNMAEYTPLLAYQIRAAGLEWRFIKGGGLQVRVRDEVLQWWPRSSKISVTGKRGHRELMGPSPVDALQGMLG